MSAWGDDGQETRVPWLRSRDKRGVRWISVGCDAGRLGVDYVVFDYYSCVRRCEFDKSGKRYGYECAPPSPNT